MHNALHLEHTKFWKCKQVSMVNQKLGDMVNWGSTVIKKFVYIKN